MAHKKPQNKTLSTIPVEVTPDAVASLANVPEELRTGNRFVAWREEVRDEKPTKIPINPHTGARAESDSPATWGNFAEAIAFYRENPATLSGLGRMFVAADGIIGIDFDDCLDEHGELIRSHPAAKWLPQLDTYSEVSPSGNGVKAWVHAVHAFDGKSGRRDARQGVEVYRERRYFTLTGQRLPQFSGRVESRQAVVDDLYRAIFGAKDSGNATTTLLTNVAEVDAEIIGRALNSKSGKRFKALWEGNIDDYGSQSEADAALCRMLWFWTGNRESVRRLFGKSQLGQREKWHRLDYQESTLKFSCNGEIHTPMNDMLQTAQSYQRPKVRLPGDNWIMSQTSSELGRHLADKPFFRHNDDIVMLDGGRLQIVSAQTFRTLVERYVVGYRIRKNGPVTSTLRDEEARGIMASSQFREQLRPLRRVNSCRLPVLRADGNLELLPEGYDAASETFTVSTVAYLEDMPLDTAKQTINDLLSEFDFADGDRSKAVAVAALVGLYAGHLLPDGALRPCFIITKNAEGAGATTLVFCIVTPILGRLPTGVASGEDEEMRKLLTTAVREAQQVLFFDNLKSHLSSAPLEAFISSPTWRDRLLGVNQTVTGRNDSTVFVTANGATLSPDMRRRCLFSVLHLKVERAEDRRFRRSLDLPTLLSLRPQILAACWSVVRHWDSMGRPAPSRPHSAFPEWARVVGGMVEAAGWACPLETADVGIDADEDGEAMRILVDAMRPGKKHTFGDIVSLCHENQCFEGLVGNGELTNANRVTLARVLRRYDHRHVNGRQFVLEGKGHKRRYHVETVGDESTLARSARSAPQPEEKNVSPAQSKQRVERVERADRAHPAKKPPKFTRAAATGCKGKN